MDDLIISDSKPIAKLIKRGVIKVRFIEHKPQQNGKIKREMLPLNSLEGKVINLNLHSFAACAASEAREILKEVISEMPRAGETSEEEHNKIIAFLSGSVSQVEFFELMRIYHGLQKFKFEHEDFGNLEVVVPKQELGDEAQRYADIVQRLTKNNYLNI